MTGGFFGEKTKLSLLCQLYSPDIGINESAPGRLSDDSVEINHPFVKIRGLRGAGKENWQYFPNGSANSKTFVSAKVSNDGLKSLPQKFV